MISIYLDPSWRTWLANSLLQMPNEASFHLLTTDTWQWLLLCHTTKPSCQCGTILKCQWWLHRCLMCSTCYSHAMYTSMSKQNFLYKSVCYIVYCLSVHLRATFICFKSYLLWLNHVLKQRNWMFECHEQNEIMCVRVRVCMCKYTSYETVYTFITLKLHP